MFYLHVCLYPMYRCTEAMYTVCLLKGQKKVSDLPELGLRSQHMRNLEGNWEEQRERKP